MGLCLKRTMAFVVTVVGPAVTGEAVSGQLLFEQARASALTGRMGASGSAWIDVDGDGFTDVAIAARDSMPSRVYRNVNGSFQQVSLPLAARDANAVAWGDIDGDGDPDLAVALQDGIALYETRLRADGFELVSIDSAAGLTGSVRPRGGTDAIAFGDIDGDHDLDIVAAAYGNGGVSVLLNDGRGRFRMAQRDAFPFAGYMGGVHIADLDGDGRTDVLTVGAPMPGYQIGTVVYWNERTGWRADRDSEFARHEGALGVSVGDVDADGDLDVFIAGWRPGTPSALYINEGGRRFRRSPQVFSDRVVGSAFADLDGDGTLDIVASTGYTQTGVLLVWLGDGRGGFTATNVPGLTDAAGRYSGLTVIDVDRDGRPDVHVGSTVEAARLFRNMSPPTGWLQLELRNTPDGVVIPGAQITAIARTDARGLRSTISLAQQSGFGGHAEPVAHFAVPTGSRIASVEIHWPGGVFTSLDTPQVGRRHIVRAPPAPVSRDRPPSVALPAELARVLRAYEQAWAAGGAEHIARLFVEDGMAASRLGWVHGPARISSRYSRTTGDLRLRAVRYDMAGDLAVIIGAYGYGPAAAERDQGIFMLALQRIGEEWRIVADLDAPNHLLDEVVRTQERS